MAKDDYFNLAVPPASRKRPAAKRATLQPQGFEWRGKPYKTKAALFRAIKEHLKEQLSGLVVDYTGKVIKHKRIAVTRLVLAAAK